MVLSTAYIAYSILINNTKETYLESFPYLLYLVQSALASCDLSNPVQALAFGLQSS